MAKDIDQNTNYESFFKMCNVRISLFDSQLFFYCFSKRLNEQSQLVANNRLPGLQNILTKEVESIKKVCDNMPSYFQLNLNNLLDIIVREVNA